MDPGDRRGADGPCRLRREQGGKDCDRGNQTQCHEWLRCQGCWLLATGCYLLAVSSKLSAVSCQLSAVSCQPSVQFPHMIEASGQSRYRVPTPVAQKRALLRSKTAIT